ncbi:hypothetical protein DPMN_045525 [Dreissena polymorpha]|uniref:Uncharacterized protein n=1 Tax=Dreissena polymorpha TaxID=45954 RepID=A0A9D4D678_DREPO|nr:hypothetical protein DPMN_045525 [Dreissena polymorpha]
MRRYQIYWDAREWGPFFELKSEALCDKRMNPRVIWSHRFAKCISLAPTGTSGIRGCGGRKGYDLGLTFRRFTLAGRRIK